MKSTLKTKQEAFDLNSELLLDDFSLLNETNQQHKVSKWTTFKYWYYDTSANIYKYFVRHPLYGYSFKRILYGLITLLLSIIILYVVIRLITPDTKYLPPDIEKTGLSRAQQDKLLEDRMKRFGVYGSLIPQILTYLKNITPFIPKQIVLGSEVTILQNGNAIIDSSKLITETRWVYLGVTTATTIAEEGSDALSIFLKAMPYSFAIGSVSVLISYALAILIGVRAAKKKGKLFDNVFNGISALLLAIPSIVIIIGTFIFSVAVLGNSGIYNTGSFATRFWPIFAIVVINLPGIATFVRRYIVDEMTVDYAKFALAKGTSSNKTYYVHIFRNAGVRIIRSIPSEIILTVFGSSMIVETQWAIPGMGRLIKESAGGNDFFVFLGFTVLSSFVSIFAKLLADLVHVLLDPRVSLTKD
ncbi:oligopeptide ABC transporter permease OppB [Mycoplasma leachii]|uniref:Oligopeptide ABC transporter, permease component n=1 Tax=Mycoplasma leachii 06049 TaxID=1188244 RepID=A0A2T4I9B2_9MOLU|nr:oligopeptide ABC transporter permease OppB [Mycoplasma leachii]PTD31103.1 Oligopeptide ABC transporter, permease component [Mycoplasma leachii 06049]